MSRYAVYVGHDIVRVVEAVSYTEAISTVLLILADSGTSVFAAADSTLTVKAVRVR